MRRKRLQHSADILCQMFCGWQLHDSYPALERLGSGTLTVDALTEACTFDGREIPSLSIARVLSSWLRGDLEAHRIDVGELREALLTVRMRFGRVAKAERRTRDAHFDRQGHHLVPPEFVTCTFECESRVVTDERVYRSTYEDLEEWPSGWPGRR